MYGRSSCNGLKFAIQIRFYLGSSFRGFLGDSKSRIELRNLNSFLVENQIASVASSFVSDY